MDKKGGLIALFLLVLLLLVVSGCIKKTEVIVCEPNDTIIGERCCADTDSDNICDDEAVVNETEFIPNTCGNGACENATENCTTCWKDCGACKIIIYKYIPRNFTLGEITHDINGIYRNGIKFRKDINVNEVVAKLFYYDLQIPRYMADFLDVKYKPLVVSRWMLLSNIVNDVYLLNTSGNLLKYSEFMNWYVIHSLKSREAQTYEERITKSEATAQYPTQRTGYEKWYEYSEWEFRNFTKEEDIIYNNVTEIEDWLVESVYGSITDYDITYKSGEFTDHDYDNNEVFTIEQFKGIEETKLTYIHSMTLTCSRNLAITIYEYDYSTIEYTRINKESLDNVVEKNRASLTRRARNLKSVCDQKYKNEVFVYDSAKDNPR
ncbi:hypothetical protein ACFL3V_01150 [Nanoarchaeota archaeon]